jgi:hypothetical protein
MHWQSLSLDLISTTTRRFNQQVEPQAALEFHAVECEGEHGLPVDG